jgi:hypothetical protein
MSIESFALEKLKARHPELVKNGLRRVLRTIDEMIGAAEFVGDYTPGFIPDATIWDAANQTIKVFEIEDTSRINAQKLRTIQRFGHDLYDETGCYTELWVTDRWGMDEKKVWQVKDEIMWTYEPTGEWLSETEIDRRERSTPDT